MSKVNYKHRNLKDALYGLVCLANIATTDKELIDNLEGDCKREIAEYELTRKELAKYKEIEEELGIDILTYFKIKKAKKVYAKDELGIIDEKYLRDNFDGLSVYNEGFVDIPECDEYLYIGGYGKDWALTREELEK